mgnify:CR=1 FL=1
MRVGAAAEQRATALGGLDDDLNAYRCTGTGYTEMHFDSLDNDKYTRRVHPVRVVGELVEVTGEVYTYYGLTEIVDPSVSGDGSAAATMTPLVVTTGELGTAASCSGEQFEGLLVTVSNATVLSEPNSYGEITIDDGSGETQLEDGLRLAPDAVRHAQPQHGGGQRRGE